MSTQDLHEQSEALEDALDRYTVDLDVETEREPTDPDRFVVDDESKAEWALRKLRRIALRRQRAEQLADEQVRRITGWLRAEQQREARSEEYFVGLLQGYHRRLLAEDPRRKTVSFPSGELRARKAPDRWNFEEELFIKFAESHDLKPLVRVKKEVDKPAAKKTLKVTDSGTAVTPDGEIVEGVTVEDGEITYKVEPNLDEGRDSQ